MPKRLTQEEFLQRAYSVHGDKYDYSKATYINNGTKVCIICPEHGEFWQTPNSHLNGNGCPSCVKLKKLTTEEFIKRAKEIHGDKYDYSKSKYTNKRTKLTITCPIHGDFEQTPHSHIHEKNGCPKCGEIRAKERKMDCKNHRKTKEEFQNDLDVLYKGKYEVIGEYINNKTKIEVFCHNKNKNGEEHGSFFCKPNDLICGHGCCRCIKSKMEEEIEDFLTENNIEFEFQKHFKWLKRQSIDFFLPKHNIAIECQGQQHFMPIDFKNIGKEYANKCFEKNCKNDLKKNNLCKKNNVYLLYYANYKYDFPYEVITDKQELLTKILNYDQK